MTDIIVSLTHQKVATLPDDNNPNHVQSSDFNKPHKMNLEAFLDAVGFPIIAGDPNGTTPTRAGAVATDRTNGQLWQHLGGTSWTPFVRSDGGTAPAATVVAVIGDSNTAGVVQISPNVSEFGVNDPDVNIRYNAIYGLAANEPVAMFDMATGALRPHLDSGNINAAFDLALGKTLIANGDWWLTKFGISGVRLADWIPASSYGIATFGVNLYTAWKNRMVALLAVSGRKLGAVVVNLGTNDAANSTDANAFAARMGALIAQIRADFGAGVVVVWIKTHVSTGNSFTSTVRTQIDLGAASVPNVKVVKIDDTTLAGDLLHYTQIGSNTIGPRAGEALLDQRGYQRRKVTGPVDVVAWAPAAFSDIALSPLAPADIQDGDTLALFITSGTTAGTFSVSQSGSTASAWTLITSIQSVSVSGVVEQIALYTKTVLQAELDQNSGTIAPTTVADISGENAAQIFCWRGPNRWPIVVASQATIDGSSGFGTGPLSIAGVTTTKANQAVFVFSGGFAGGIGASQTVTNGAVSSVTKIKDASYQEPDTGFQLITVTRGVMVTQGATGAWSLTSATNMVKGAIVVAVN